MHKGELQNEKKKKKKKLFMCELMNPLNENTITKDLTNTREINEIYFAHCSVR